MCPLKASTAVSRFSVCLMPAMALVDSRDIIGLPECLDRSTKPFSVNAKLNLVLA